MRNFIVSIIFAGLLLFLGLSVVSCIKETFPGQPAQAPSTNQPVPTQEVAPTEGGDEVTSDDCDEYGRPRNKNRPQRRHLFPRLHRNR